MPLRTIIIKAAATAHFFSVDASTAARGSADLLRMVLSRPASPLLELALPELPEPAPPLEADEAETATEPAIELP